MLTVLRRVVLLLCLAASAVPVFPQGPQREKPVSVTANEATARIELLDESSLFSIELSANSATPVPATLTARIIEPDDALFAEGSVPLSLSAKPQRVQTPLQWTPRKGL